MKIKEGKETKIHPAFEEITDDVLKMYEVSGLPISEHSFDRYREDELKWGESIRQLDLIEQIREAPSHKKTTIISQAFESKDPKKCRMAVKMIFSVPESQIASLISKAFETGDLETFRKAADVITSVPDGEQKKEIISKIIDFISQAFETRDPEVCLMAADMIVYVPENEKPALVSKVINFISQAFKAGDPETYRIAVIMIRAVPDDKIAPLISQAFETKDPKTCRIATDMIAYYVPENEELLLVSKVTDFILQAFKTKDPETCCIAVDMISSIPKYQDSHLILQSFISQAFETKDPQTCRKAVGLIRSVSNDKKAPLISQAFETGDIETCRMVSGMITSVPESERSDLVLKVVNLISQTFETGDPKKCSIAADMIRHLPKLEQQTLGLKLEDLILKAFETSDPRVCCIFASMIRHLSDDKQDEMFKKMKELDVFKYVIQNRLYSSVAEEDMDKFGRKPFAKDGSETTLVTGELKDKVIVRHIKKGCFRAWKKAYESHQAWESIGYVPIEPIVSYRVNKEGLVDVFSGVLDINLQQYIDMCGEFVFQLMEQKRQIEDILSKKFSIYHGHTHEGNFALRFFRKENGEFDYDRMPRIYLIDFDQAFFTNS